MKEIIIASGKRVLKDSLIAVFISWLGTNIVVFLTEKPLEYNNWKMYLGIFLFWAVGCILSEVSKHYGKKDF